VMRHPRPNVPELDPRPTAQLTVTMVAGIVVIEPPDDLDHDATDALVQMVTAALATGEHAMLHLDSGRAPEPDRWPLSAADARTAADVAPRPVTTIGPGFIRLDTGNDTWTIDLGHRRFCRSAAPVDPRFVEAPSWTAIRAAWVTPERTTVLTAAGTYVSAPTTWMAGERVVAA
jgi:hypothetical protein